MNLDVDRNFIWVLVFAFIVIALANKDAFPFKFLNQRAENNECEQDLEPCYIYKSKKNTKEHRSLQ